MLAMLRELLSPSPVRQPEPHAQERLATALLLAEMARADYEVAGSERDKIAELLASRYQLSTEQTQTLVDRALSGAERATSLYEYVKVLNSRLSYPAKCELVEMLWQVANADGHVDAYEEHQLRKLAGLLYVSEDDYVRAKLSALGD